MIFFSSIDLFAQYLGYEKNDDIYTKYFLESNKNQRGQIEFKNEINDIKGVKAFYKVFYKKI